MSKWINIGDIIDMSTEKSQRDIKVGITLTFNQEGSIHSYKVMKLGKDGNVWVRPINLMDPNHYEHDVDGSDETVEKYGVPYCRNCDNPVTQPSKFEA